MRLLLKELNIRNFKGILSFDFRPDGKSAYILGDNGTGKSTVYDAYSWLLFGCDSRGNSQFDIEPRDETGAVKDPDAVTEVTCVFRADEQELILRKRCLQKWVRVRGRSDLTYQGNTNEFEINGVPCTMAEYKDRLDELINLDLLRILSGVYRFPSLQWQDQRALLFELITMGDDPELMDGAGGRYDELRDLMVKTKATFDATVDTIKRDRKRAVEAQDRLPAQIEENRHYLSGDDEPGLREKLDASREALEAEADRLTEKRASETGSGELAKLLAERRETEAEIVALKAENEAYKREQRSQYEAEHETARLRQEERDAERRAMEADDETKRHSEQAASYEDLLLHLRKKYAETQSDRYGGETVCPRCGREYDRETLKKARQHFDEEKAAILKELTAEGRTLNEKLKNERQSAEKSLDRLREAKQAAQEAQDRLKEAGTFKETDMDGYSGRLDELNGKLDDIARRQRFETECRDKILADLDREIAEKRSRISDIFRQIGDIDREESVRVRIRELEKELEEKMRLIDRYDRLLAMADDYTMYKAKLAEDGVNSLFRTVKFKLFDVQKNGGLKYCCEATVDGIGFNRNLNTSARINAGIDIINAFSKRYDVHAPVFVDNGESVTRLQKPKGSQLIRLQVEPGQTKLKEVTCE